MLSRSMLKTLNYGPPADLSRKQLNSLFRTAVMIHNHRAIKTYLPSVEERKIIKYLAITGNVDDVRFVGGLVALNYPNLFVLALRCGKHEMAEYVYSQQRFDSSALKPLIASRSTIWAITDYTYALRRVSKETYNCFLNALTIEDQEWLDFCMADKRF